MAAEADEFHRRPLDGNYKTCLTRIGLLMEGLGKCKSRTERQSRQNAFLA